jgi:hydroxylamine reductase
MDTKMFCFQCQETARNFGCTQVGVCGKQPETSNLMDLMIWVTKGLSQITTRLRAEGRQIDKDVNHLVTYNLFQTITNANFDDDKVVERILLTIASKEQLLADLQIRRTSVCRAVQQCRYFDLCRAFQDRRCPCTEQ